MNTENHVIIQALNNALACELLSLMRYKKNYFSALDLDSGLDAEAFLDLAEVKEDHADLLAERIVELGGKPEFPLAEPSLELLMEEDLAYEERQLREIQNTLRRLENRDPETQRILEEILRQNEQRVQTLERRLKRIA